MSKKSLLTHSLIIALSVLLGACSKSTEVSVSWSQDAHPGERVIEVDLTDLGKESESNLIVLNSNNDTVPSQITYDNKLLIFDQVIPDTTIVYAIAKTDAPVAADTIAFAQTRPDKQDDLAWENDHGGYRLYGNDYHKGNGPVRGYDVWTKSVTHPVLAQRYENDHKGISYHVDQGDGMDVYTVGYSLGAGLTAPIDSNGNFVYPKGYETAEILDNGPLRLTVRLNIAPIVVDGDTIVETRTIMLNRGDWLNKTLVAYNGATKPLHLASGIVVHAQNPQAYRINHDNGIITYDDLTDNIEADNGIIYIGVVAQDADSLVYRPFETQAGDALGHVMALSTLADNDSTLTYYWGSAWSKGGVESSEQWDSLVAENAKSFETIPETTISQTGIAVEDVFKYIIGLGAAVMMPIIFTILGLCIGIPFGKSMMSGLKVGVGFIGLSIVTALLTTSLGPALEKIVGIYDLELQVFDMGWPAAASVAYNTAVGAFIIPVCLIVNLLMLFTKTTRTVNIDLWNYWHFAFIGAVVYFASDSLLWGFGAAIICYIITLVIADMTAKKFQGFYEGMEGISIPQPFCASFAPFAWIMNKGLDKIPGMNKLEIDAEGLKRKFGILGEPLFLGVIVGIGIGCLTCKSWGAIVDNIPYILGLGIKMGAVMELIPRITALFIEGLRPISDATRQLIARKFKGAAGLNIGMSPALVIGHPTTLVVSLLLIPVTLVLAVILPGNQFLPLASLAGMFYLFPLVLPFTKGNVLKTFIIGLVILVIGLLMVTDMSAAFTLAAADVYAQTGDSAVAVPEGFSAGSLDFASSPLSWIIYKLTYYPSWRWIGAGILVLSTLALMIKNRINILRNQQSM
ncbi:MAG: DUF4861 family protein [Ruminococcus flavefaciens]|nr:DUF4861 family protein [Ruminococcus flavefaciens]